MHQSMLTHVLIAGEDNDGHATAARSLFGLDIKHKHDGVDQNNHSSFEQEE
jgi:hypothetical protein